ncbi:MAG: SDR family NAD(P)-dependent oxidoreductase, partial [Pseudomonadota bacterium]
QTLAADLLHRHSANVILLSRETLPPRDAWARYLESHPASDRTARRIRSVQALEDIGKGRVLCVAADVANVEQMRAAVGQAEDMFGALTGVIHAAGQIQDNPILTKSESSIQQVLSPKISGLHVLDQIFPDGMLEVMVLCASTSTATRPAGQVDYIAANAYLNAWASQRANGATRVIAVNWGVWADVGMAAEARKTRLQAEQPSERVATDLPLLDEAGFDAQGNRVFVTQLRDGEHWVLDEHRTSAGDALMPGTGFVELAAQALRAHGESGGFEIRDLYFFRPLHVDAAGREMVLRLETTPTGYTMTVHSASKTGYVLHAQAELNLGAAAAAEMLDLGAIADRCHRKDSCPPEQCLHSPQEAHLRFGPRWQVLRSTSYGDREGWARLTLPDAYHGDLLDGYHLHPGLLDLATGWAIDLAPSYDANMLWVPVSYRSIRLHRPLPADIRSWVRLGSETDADGFATFDVTLTDAQGKICVEITGFQMQRLQEPLNFADPVEPDARAADLGLAVQANEAPLSQDEKRLHHNILQGISQEDGAEALRRALSTGLSQVFVSSMHLPDLITQASQTGTVESDSAQSFDRPELDTAYVAPRNEIEKTLAGFFESLLGVSQVGVEDSFFDLGGHSLIAVRLFAQINRVFDIEFPMSLLFEAPNVASIAERIEALTGPADTNNSEPQDGPARFTHLVPLFEAENTLATPFFIVAGMFGNVLNLRHLALMLGRDRSVYGLQARGLIGEDEPHRTIEEAATAYIEELRQVQPHGPYLLSGFSGGGITAFEMARQLQAAGEQVALLTMLDTPLPVRPTLSKKDKALIKLHEIRRKGPAYLAEWARSRWAWEQQKRR